MPVLKRPCKDLNKNGKIAKKKKDANFYGYLEGLGKKRMVKPRQ